MKRKEIVVADKVFDLGLKGLDSAISVGESEGRTRELEVGTTVFQVGVSTQDKALVFHETGETGLRNIVWMRFVAVGLWWPPVKVLSCFTYF